MDIADVLERTRDRAGAAQEGRIGFEEHADLEIARRGFVQQRGQIRLSLVGVAARTVPCHQERVNARGLRLLDVTAHGGAIAAHVGLGREIGQLVVGPRVFVKPGVVEGEDQRRGTGLLRRRGIGARACGPQPEQHNGHEQQHGQENAPAQVKAFV
ncbi:MAG: hypothetical protein R2851_19830 [Caldilineaceae bacterium]